jgi:ElaB/YqjD/DUF883 family membrane-anchored ribosome-binding protein
MLQFAVMMLCCALLAGCRTTYYAAMEKFGYEKRDLLKEAVIEARDEQKDAGQEFKDALTRLKEMYAFEGGQLEKTYNRLKSDFDSCEAAAEAVRKRIRAMDQVAADLFAEWETEIGQISSAALAADSRQKLRQTKDKYAQLAASLRSAEGTMDPVLRQFKDHVLYLKHNLNAQAIAALRGEATSIQNEITRLISQMNQAIQQADEFIKTMP